MNRMGAVHGEVDRIGIGIDAFYRGAVRISCASRAASTFAAVKV